jgi:hypothetical protein
MTLQARNYHNLDHVFSLIDDSSPILTLAALFHDLVYCQVDMGFLPKIRQIINPYVLEKDGKIFIRSEMGDEDRMVRVVQEIFGFSGGQTVPPTAGLNEFLSAVVMVKKLENLLPDKTLFKLVVCIEASVPFRESASNGEDYFDTLEKKAISVNEKWGLDLSLDEIIEGIQLAVQFANQDVGSFAEPDVACYLETTWKLLPELNASLRSIEVYSICEYRMALQSMETSVSRLNPEKIFHQYRGIPSDTDYAWMVQKARQNIQTGLDYLRIKLVAQAILEALACETGGDAPLALFVGDILHHGSHAHRLEDYLPEIGTPEWVDSSSDLYKLLGIVQGCETNFDLSTAPLSLFIYKSLPPHQINRCFESSNEFFAEKLSAPEYLERMDPAVVSAVATACAAMVFTRRDLLLKFAN